MLYVIGIFDTGALRFWHFFLILVIQVTNCSVNPGLLSLQYYGADASEFYAIGNMIQDGIDTAIRDKICMLPLLIGDFVRAKV